MRKVIILLGKAGFVLFYFILFCFVLQSRGSNPGPVKARKVLYH
jgi:hypothetical protein